ncbi:hypothetical protein [Sphingomonas sp.]|uniref:hypothetical protein n=1 Tax=Sphingomonas sp. TaxID=28214 RepID=UPI003B3B73CE
MTHQAIDGRRSRGEWTFFATMSLVVAGIVVAGFGPSVRAGFAPPGLPIWVHLHGAVMTSWILLFALQAALVRRRSLPLHRTLGYASIALVVLMVPLGIATNLLAIRRGATPPFFTDATMFAADLCDMLLFVGCYIWALLWRHRRDWHKRLLLSGTVLLSWPAIARLRPLGALGMDMILSLSVLALIGLMLAGPIHDLITRRRIHPAYLWGVAAAVILDPLYKLVALAPPVQAIVQSVAPAAG